MIARHYPGTVAHYRYDGIASPFTVSPDVPKVEEKDEGNGVKVIVEYRTNPEGKRVKVSTASSLNPHWTPYR